MAHGVGLIYIDMDIMHQYYIILTCLSGSVVPQRVLGQVSAGHVHLPSRHLPPAIYHTGHLPPRTSIP